MFSVSFLTLGCKLNQFETEALAESFNRAGFAVRSGAGGPGPGPELLILNTCTVTSKAEQKARRLIRRQLRENPRSWVIVTGCYARMERAALTALGEDFPGRLFLAERKDALLELPALLGPAPSAGELWELLAEPGLPRADSPPRGAPDPFRFNPQSFSFHSRAFLKIQDGCDRRCTYCRVCLARGPSVSLPAETALARLRGLEEAAYPEALITGVNISQYRDRGGPGLSALLAGLLAGTRTIALRIASLEPEALTEELAEILAHPRIRPHFQLSVQSGSPRVLARMGRPYGPEAVERAAALLRRAQGDPFLGCDIIAGFPGEGEEDFELTLGLCRAIGFAGIHPFPYSPRPGTAAFRFGPPVPEREAVRRVGALRELAEAGRRAYLDRWTGRVVGAVIQGKSEKKPGYSAAVSDNYLKLELAGTVPGGERRCRIVAGVPAGEGFDALAELLDGQSGET